LGRWSDKLANEERRSESLFSWADRRAVKPFC
jgi:hypothetical protein